MPSNKSTFFLAWGMIVLVGAWVTFEDPPAERDWFAYTCAMAIIPLGFLFLGVGFALFKAVILVPYLLVKCIINRDYFSSWCKSNWNWNAFKHMFIWNDFSCFYTSGKGSFDANRPNVHRPKNYRTKEEYEELKKEGKL